MKELRERSLFMAGVCVGGELEGVGGAKISRPIVGGGGGATSF